MTSGLDIQDSETKMKYYKSIRMHCTFAPVLFGQIVHQFQLGGFIKIGSAMCSTGGECR